MATGNLSRQLVPTADFHSKSMVVIAGSCELDGDDTDPVLARGDGFSGSHSGDNDYLITFAEKYPMMICGVVTLEDASGGTNVIDAVASLEAYDSSAGTIVVRVAVESAGALTKDDTLNGERLNFLFFMQRRNALAVTHA